VMSYLAKAEVFSGLITRSSLSLVVEREFSKRKKPGRDRNGQTASRAKKLMRVALDRLRENPCHIS